jgi:hypothetical protein
MTSPRLSHDDGTSSRPGAGRWYLAPSPMQRALTPIPSVELDAATLWRHVQRLIDRVTAVLEGDTVVDDCLDIVVELLGADRGLVMLEQADATTLVVNARGPRRTISPAEREEVSRTIIRRAVDSDAVFVDGSWCKRSRIRRPSVLDTGMSSSLR